ncbi:acyl-CoA dehydrogenase [Frankia sp. R43]|uniref:acyl-CoA dehydrogenase family protein n=1 Tax=Frankia sp. R43 TaxID=269536 RepID=UPI0006C9F110|nr:acyl-CoA dehydrogenase family protein [Frankia sp. R43]KPM56561.1 acyl-CoA dehydrogenase [Frankia sp. R43]
MFLDYTPEQLALRRRLRAYFAELLTPADRADLASPALSPAPATATTTATALATSPATASVTFRRIVRRLGADGWLGLGWPVEYGGQGRPATDQYVMFDEVQRAGVPFPFVTVNTVGPTLMRFGSDQQKERYLPAILAGESVFAIGYSEPEAGTDLASLRTSARLEGDEWVVRGGKVFTSGANHADHIWLAARTDPDLPRHRGISILLVPTAQPGFRWTPIMTVGGVMTTATYYDDVRVPAANLVGERGGGWRMITTQLNHERVGLAALGGHAWRMWGEVRRWALATPDPTPAAGAPAGARIADRPWVRADLARCFARLEVMKLLNWQMATTIATGELRPADSSTVKFYGTETHVEVYRLLLGILGAGAWLRTGSPGALLAGEIERAARAAQINTFGGGVNEVQREIVASAGLGMARRAR